MAESSIAPRSKPRQSNAQIFKEWKNGLSAFVDASTDGFVLFDENLDLVGINPAGQRLVGLSEEAARAGIGKNILQLIPGIRESGRYDKYLNVMRTGDPFIADDIVPHPKFGDIRLMVKAFKAGNGLGIVVGDIPERKRAEEELNKYRQHLEELVEEHTAELEHANEQLQQEIVEHRKTEKTLREAEQRYRTAADFTYDWESWENPDGTLQYVSLACERITGYSAKEFMDHPGLLTEVILPEDGEIWAEHRHDVAETPGRHEVQFRIRQRDGETRWIEHACQPVVDEEGAFLGYRASNRDITERKRVDEELRIKDWAIASSINAICMADLEGKTIYVNASFLKMWGCDSSEETMGKPAVEFWQDRKQAASVVRALLRKGIWQGELVALRADGSTFDAHVLASKVEDDAGEPICLMSSIIDITERKQMEEALRAKEEYFRSLIENSLEAILVVNGDGTIRYQSPSAQRVMGYRPEDRAPENPFRFIHSEDVSKATEAFSQLVQNPGITRYTELCAKHEDGSWHTLEILAKSLLDDPVVRGIVVNFRDITERKRAEEKLERLYEKEKKLRQQLEEEMKKRVEFTRALAHELKTPLTPVVMSSQLLTSELKDETLLRVAQNIYRGASNLNTRIDELLDLARGEIGMLQIKPEQVDVLQLFQEVVEDVSSVTSSRGQSLILRLPPSLPLVWCDKGRLRQIVLNLLNNAFKFTPAGGEITLRAKQEDGSLVVGVRDTGPGIAEEEQKRIFNPYHRLEGDRERLSGLGLGLALCKTLVELHKGRIWVRSRAGKGSAFGFSLPLEGPSQ